MRRNCSPVRASDFHEIDVSANRDIRKEMIARANGRSTFPQIFIGTTHVGGCDDLYALEEAGKLDPLLAEAEGIASMSAAKAATFKVGLIQMRSGLDPQVNLTHGFGVDRRGQARRRRLRADAGNDQHSGDQARSSVRQYRRRGTRSDACRLCAKSRASLRSTSISARSRSRRRRTKPSTARC